MLGRIGTFSGRCRIELQQCCSFSTSPPQLPRLHCPAGSWSRKYRTVQETGQMSLAQINHILRANEYSHTLPRGPMGSLVSIATCCHPTTLVRTIGAVPHACRAAAAYCLTCLTAMLGRRVLMQSAKDSSTTSESESCLLPNQCLSLERRCLCRPPLRVAMSGCTACVAHVSNGVLHVANLGDRRAVLGVQEPDGHWSVVSLTNDHNAQNPDEMLRILGEHPPSERKTVVRHNRLLGQLLPFRAFGDVRFKWSAEMLSRVYETRPDILSAVSEAVRTLLPPHYLTPPYLSAQPEVTGHHRIRPADKFLVLATDGLWELMHRQTVIQLVGEQLTGLQQQRPIIPGVGIMLGGLQRLLLDRRGQVLSVLEDGNATTHLLRHALGDDGYGAVAPNRRAKMLSLPAELARRYRDDITITVVHLNEPDL